MEQILKVEGLCRDYGRGTVTHAVDHVDFSVEKGEFVGIMGPSGSGKTTLLNCIATIDTVSAGDILLDGVSLADLSPRDLAQFRRENLGFVFQDFNLLDTLTIGENIALALTIRRTAPQAIDPQVQAMANTLNIGDILDKYPYQVSGGQKQRCACARAIINHPKLVLADEPTGALDSHSAQMLLATLEDMHRQLGATILMVTHDAFTASWCRRILFIQDGVLFRELRRGDQDRRTFFAQILGVVGALGGDAADVW